MPDLTQDQAPSTFTVTVFTRHSDDCSKRVDPQWKRCNCRKSLYLYEHGKVRYKSARTRSWEQALKVAEQEMDARDPIKKALKEIAQREEEKARQAKAREITIEAALDEWLAGIKLKSRLHRGAVPFPGPQAQELVGGAQAGHALRDQAEHALHLARLLVRKCEEQTGPDVALNPEPLCVPPAPVLQMGGRRGVPGPRPEHDRQTAAARAHPDPAPPRNSSRRF